MEPRPRAANDRRRPDAEDERLQERTVVRVLPSGSRDHPEATDMMKKLPTILVAMLILVVILLMMCSFQVRFTEAAVVTRLDKVQK